jgi:hypothetical protein
MQDPYRPPAVAFPATADETALKNLSIFHYVVAGLMALFSCMFIVHIVIGVNMLLSHGSWPAAGPQGPPSAPVPAGVAAVFVGLGSFAIILGWTMSVLTVIAGRSLTRRRRYTFCLVIAGLLCLWMPFGTILGVFTLVTLTKAPVRAQFEGQRA